MLVSAIVGGPFSELLPGTELGGYNVIRTLGKGGMARVYLAQHPRLPRQYALKVLSPHLGDDPRFRARFEREAHLAAQLDHPNVVAVHDRGIDNGVMWLAMQYIDGTDAGAWLQANPDGMTPADVASIIRQAAAGLDAAHRQGMLHRDIKPGNLLLTTDGRVLVSDFGIARALDDATNLTDTGTMVATIAYAAPEIISGEHADRRSDVYSLGCTLYELLTGSQVFPRPSQVAVMDAHLQAAPPRATDRRPDLPPAIDNVIEKALSKDPAQRFETCGDLSRAVSAALESQASTRILEIARPVKQPKKSRRRRVLAAAIVLTLAATAAGVWALWPDSQRSLAGRWIGAVTGDDSGRLVADISDNGTLSANVSYPDIPCSGHWTQTKNDSGLYSLSESITEGSCPSAAVTLRKDSSGNLQLVSTYFSASQNRRVEVTATLSRNIDLGLDVPITVPACDGTGVVMLGAAINPGSYAGDVQRFLDKHPGASYLRTDAACPSLRQATKDGKPIYVVYRPVGKSTSDICAAVGVAGGDAYGAWLDRTSDPTKSVKC